MKDTSIPMPDWNAAPKFGRRDTLLLTLRRLHQLCTRPPCIVEIGTARDERPEACQGDGWSSVALGWYGHTTGGKLYTVDNEAEAIAICKRLTPEYAESIVYITADSLKFLGEWSVEERGTIDLVYLDGLDYTDPIRSEQHHLAEAKAILPALSPCCLILIDDTYPSTNPDIAVAGKGALAVPFLLSEGFKVEWVSGGQALLSRGAEEIPPEIGIHGKIEMALTERLTQYAHRKWTQMPALCFLGKDFREWERTPEATEYLSTVARLCGRGGSSCEIGSVSAFGPSWLSRQGIQATGMLLEPTLLERARQANYWLSSSAQFLTGDPLALYREDAPRYKVIHHQDLASTLSAPWLRSVLAQQVALADWVVFSVPSVFAAETDEREALGCRLLPLEVWRQLLAPFDVAELRTFGNSNASGQERILVVLRGQALTPALGNLMYVGPEPYPFGITVIVHTRNERHQLADCLRTVQGWVDETIVCDMGSTDGTVDTALQFTDKILHHPHIPLFDRSRNCAAMLASFSHSCFLDADERLAEGLGPRLRHLLATQGHLFEAMALPFRTFFAGKAMASIPPYKAASIYKNGTFFYNARPHQGARIEGRVAYFPSNDEKLLCPHLSYTSLSHYVQKMDAYTTSEAANLFADGRPFHLQEMVAHAVRDMCSYYDGNGALRDGPHGVLWVLLSGYYRFLQYGKLWEQRFRTGQAQPNESLVPESLEQMLEFALAVVRAGKEGKREGGKENTPSAPLSVHSSTDNAGEVGINTGISLSLFPSFPLSLCFFAPLYDPSGYGEEGRNFVFAFALVGAYVAARNASWRNDQQVLEGAEAVRMQELETRSVAPGHVQIVQNFPPSFTRHPEAGVVIGRTMFETDRIPIDWVPACNRMDYIWVPSQFNLETFRLSGVAAEKLRVIPGCFDPAPYLAPSQPTPLTEELKSQGRFTFLTVFDWSLHKGWDVLLHAFLTAFEGREDVQLVFKVWSTHGYTAEQIIAQAATFVKETLNLDLLADSRIRFIHDRLNKSDLLALYKASDAFVLPSRGEGWGRPYMEAMACGLPTIGTNWSGNLAFQSSDNSYLLDYHLTAVPELGWREIPTYKGHRWAEPSAEHLIETLHGMWLCLPPFSFTDSAEHLIETLQYVVEHPAEAKAKGAVAHEEVCTRFSREAVGKLMLEELARVLESEPHTKAPSPPAPSPRIPSLRSAGEGVSVSDRLSDEARKEAIAQPPPLPIKKRGGKGRNNKPASTKDSSQSAQAKKSPSPAERSEGSAIRVSWEGAQRTSHSLGHVNREYCWAFLKSGRVELSLVPTEPADMSVEEDWRFGPLSAREFATLSGPAQVHVRHFFPPMFHRPSQGKFVLIQPWEYYWLPKEWVAQIAKYVDEIWCYSKYVLEVYRRSGVPEEKLKLVPLGVDTNVFTPDAPPYIFTDEPGAARWHAMLAPSLPLSSSPHPPVPKAPFVFLYVGGTIHRKGFDILLDAYLKAFSAFDNVVLVVKDTCVNTVYRQGNHRERLLELANDPTRPAIIYIEQNLRSVVLAGLYTLAHYAIFPYRGEGFCLTALEALSCGCPVMATDGGPTNDFVDQSVGERIPSELRELADTKVGEWECVGRPRMFEVNPDTLARQMRSVIQDREEAKRRGQAGAERVRASWSWDHAAQVALARLQSLAEQGKEGKREGGKEKNANANPSLPMSASPTMSEGASSGVLTASASLSFPPSLLPSFPDVDISLCMIVKNEERVLGDCLTSVQPYGFQIIVVDTGSTDKTREIALSYGAEVHEHPWNDDFSEARNHSLGYATRPWILWLDADDVLPAESAEAIIRAVQNAADNVVGFVIPVQFVEGSGAASGTRVDHVKLVRNLPEVRFEGRIHEQILRSLRATGGEIVRCNAVVLHAGYDTSTDGQRRKHDRDAKILAIELQERLDDPFLMFNLGMTDHYSNKHESAVIWLRKCLAMAQPSDSIVRKAYALQAVSLRELGRVEECLQTLKEGLNITPDDPELNFYMGQQCTMRGEFAQAKEHYLQTLSADISGHFSSIDMGILGYKTFHNIGQVCLLMGDYASAKEWWQKAIQSKPEFGPSRQELFNAAVAQRDFPTAQELLLAVQKMLGECLDVWWMTAMLAQARGDRLTAERCLRLAVGANPQAVAPRLALGRELLQSERTAEAESHLKILSEAGVAEAAFFLGVVHVRKNDLKGALGWMERAQALNPGHAETQSQIESLRRALNE